MKHIRHLKREKRMIYKNEKGHFSNIMFFDELYYKINKQMIGLG